MQKNALKTNRKTKPNKKKQDFRGKKILNLGTNETEFETNKFML